jgi:hypothetical protein
MRICMPFTIETIINSTATIYQVGGAAGLNNKTPLIDAKTARAAPVDPNSRFEVDPRRVTGELIKGGIGRVEQQLVRLDRGQAIQSALCIENAKGDFGAELSSPTHIEIGRFKAGVLLRPDPKLGAAPNKGEFIEDRDLERFNRAVRDFPSCTVVEDAYELGIAVRKRYTATLLRSQLLKTLKKEKCASIAGVAELVKTRLEKKNEELRPAVQAARDCLGLKGKGIDAKLLDDLRRE